MECVVADEARIRGAMPDDAEAIAAIYRPIVLETSTLSPAWPCPNPASVALHEAMGFRHLGTYEKVGFKLGQWRDVAWFQRPLQAPPDGAQPLPPRRAAA